MKEFPLEKILLSFFLFSFLIFFSYFMFRKCKELGEKYELLASRFLFCLFISIFLLFIAFVWIINYGLNKIMVF